ncbi:MAG TPA: AlkA N-terminal domain-containing protein [Gemmatimonadales bacterium]|nr:AlkA N-terminal domain-containing protein [Gemmatimonadales bacterium]
MAQAQARPPLPSPGICERALNARDPRFDGIFFVGITSTRVYCRPTCPARVSYTNRRRFFDSAAAAERAGFRPCLRCRPELAPGRAPMDAVTRLARVAADRIGAGALNGHSVAELAGELGVSERHLRRALEREVGVSPVELAQTHRLLFAKRLLADTTLSVTSIAFASGFQSLRRFNSVFRERYGLRPGDLRRPRGSRLRPARIPEPVALNELMPLTLAYRPPLAWEPLCAQLAGEALPGVERIEPGRYLRTVALHGRQGVLLIEHAPPSRNGTGPQPRSQLIARVSASLLPVLMPLLARLRQLFDLDAEPLVVDAHLAQGGLGPLVRRRPGVRMLGALEGFEAALRTLLLDGATMPGARDELAGRVIAALGEPFGTGTPGLSHLAPDSARVAEAGATRLAALGVEPRRAAAIAAIARACAEDTLRLQPGSPPAATRRALVEIGSIEDRLATIIVMRALHWPDAFPASDPSLQRAARAASEQSLRARAEQWRPWRAYAALHLSLQNAER